VHNAGDDLDLVADEMPDVDILFDIELRQNVEVAGGGIDLGGDLRFGQSARDLVGAAERAFDLDEESLQSVHGPCLPLSFATTSTSRSIPVLTSKVDW